MELSPSMCEEGVAADDRLRCTVRPLAVTSQW